MSLFCLNAGIITSELVFIPGGVDVYSNINVLVELNTGVGALQLTEATKFKFRDSSSGLVWDLLTSDWVYGTMKSPIHIDNYIYYYFLDSSGISSEGVKRVPYTLGMFGEPEDLIYSEVVDFVWNPQLFYVNNIFYWFYADSSATDSYLKKTSNFSVIDTFTMPSYLENIVFFNNSFISLGLFNKSSVDGITWVTHTDPSFEIYTVAHNKVDKLIAINDSKMLFYDGISWSTESNLPVVLFEGVPILWLDIAYNNNVFCVIGENNTFATSIDNGTSWQVQVIPDLLDTFTQIVPMYPAKFWEHFIKTTES